MQVTGVRFGTVYGRVSSRDFGNYRKIIFQMDGDHRKTSTLKTFTLNNLRPVSPQGSEYLTFYYAPHIPQVFATHGHSIEPVEIDKPSAIKLFSQMVQSGIDLSGANPGFLEDVCQLYLKCAPTKKIAKAAA